MPLTNITVRIPELDASFPAQLVPVRQSSKAAASFKLMCPHCETAATVKQVYFCSHDDTHGPLTKGELGKGREISKGKYVKVTDEEIAAIKETTLLPALLELTVFHAEQVEAATQPNGSAYFIGVNEGSTGKMLFDLLKAHPEKALVGEMVADSRSGQKMYRLTTWNNSLFLQELIRPTEIAAGIEVGGSDYKPVFFAVYEQVLDTVAEDFDGDAFANKVKERMAEFDSNLVEAVEATTQRDVNNATLDELEALLASKLATKKAAPAKKKSTKKEAA